jgi:hypothetical protein
MKAIKARKAGTNQYEKENFENRGSSHGFEIIFIVMNYYYDLAICRAYHFKQDALQLPD